MKRLIYALSFVIMLAGSVGCHNADAPHLSPDSQVDPNEYLVDESPADETNTAFDAPSPSPDIRDEPFGPVEEAPFVNEENDDLIDDDNDDKTDDVDDDKTDDENDGLIDDLNIETSPSLIGFWHSAPDFSGGLKEWYRFYDYGEIDYAGEDGTSYMGVWDVTNGDVLELDLLEWVGEDRIEKSVIISNIEHISSGGGVTVVRIDGKKFWKLDQPVDVIDGAPVYIAYQSDFDENKYQNSEVIYVSNPRTTGGNVILAYDGDLYDFKIIVVIMDFDDDGGISYHYDRDGIIFEKDHIPSGYIVNYENTDIGTMYAEGFTFRDASGNYHTYAIWHGGRGPEINVGKIDIRPPNP